MSYQNLAEVYDRFAYDFDYDAWTDWYEKRILDLRPGAREICDVGCGTGPLAVRLAQKGYKVTGIDLSEDMLRVASDKVRAWGVPVRLVRQDMRALLLPRRVDAIVCACDGVNYLTDEKSVQRFLKCAREALKSGGVLAFDISNAGKLREMGRVGLYGEDLENETYLWQNEYDENTSLLTMRLAFTSLAATRGKAKAPAARDAISRRREQTGRMKRYDRAGRRKLYGWNSAHFADGRTGTRVSCGEHAYGRACAARASSVAHGDGGAGAHAHGHGRAGRDAEGRE